MSEMRKSVRSKRQVDYSKLAADESDDDFADSTPPLKKSKITSIKDKKTNRKKSTETVEIIKTTSTSKSSRPSLDAKRFDSDLETALRLSLCETATEVHRQSTDKPDNHKYLDRVPILPYDDISGQSLTVGDEIEFMGTEDQDSRDRRRCASKPPVVYVVDNGPDDEPDGQDAEKENRTTNIDYKLSGESVEGESSNSDSDDDFNPDDSDSDFGESKKKPVKKSTVKKTPAKSLKAAITPVATSKAKISSNARKSGPNMGTPKTQILPVSRNCIQTTPTSLTTLSIVNRTSFCMKSPLSGVSLKSPSFGLRLGLSRNQKVKSLHSCTKAQN